jgi:Tol biopolymer transport system component
VGKWRLQIQDKTNETYHVDWSPDSRYLAFSRGPASKGDPNKKGTFQAACEIVGVYAPGWNTFVVSADKSGILDLQTATGSDVVQITSDGASNKEPDWMPRKPASK